MVIDTSAIIAILRLEPETVKFLRAITDADVRLMSAANLIEAAMVLAGRGGDAAEWLELDELIQQSGVEILPFDHAQVGIAREAFLQFGKGRHPAALNFGDCAAYALAKAHKQPLLYKGSDFSKTDIASAVPID
jgi:ribonuclease VapC